MLITSKQFHKNNEQKANLELTKHPNYNIYVYTMQIKHYAKKSPVTQVSSRIIN